MFPRSFSLLQKLLKLAVRYIVYCGYTLHCAEEPASSGPADERTLIVEPDVAAIVQEYTADVFIACKRGKAVRYTPSALCSRDTSSDMALMVPTGGVLNFERRLHMMEGTYNGSVGI